MSDIALNVAVLLPGYRKVEGQPRPPHTFRAPRREFMKGSHERRQLIPLWRQHVHQYANAVAKQQVRASIANAAREAMAKEMVDTEQLAVAAKRVLPQATRLALAALGIYRQVKNPGRAITRTIRELERVAAGLPARNR